MKTHVTVIRPGYPIEIKIVKFRAKLSKGDLVNIDGKIYNVDSVVQCSEGSERDFDQTIFVSDFQ